jgi:hypothetical protein
MQDVDGLSNLPLFRRKGVVQTQEERAIEAAGGEYEAVSPNGLVAEVRRLGVRALRLVNGSLLPVVAGLEQIEFLSTGFGHADPAHITSFPRLRGLHAGDGWQGTLDFALLPELQWLVIGDGRYADGLDALLAGHEKLRSLWVIFYGRPDLRAIGDLPALERLEFKQCKIRTLAGIGGAPKLSGLTFEWCASLNSLAGIEDCRGLEYLRVAHSPRLRDLSPLARNDRLRMLDIEWTSGIQSLEPLAGHPSLEVLYFSKIADQDLDPLASMPKLKLIRANRGKYNQDPAQFNRIGAVPRTDPIFRDVARLVNP